MSAFVVDANVINLFQDERINDKLEFGAATIEKCSKLGFIALDEQGHCQQEWLECAGGTFPLALSDWIAEMMRMGLIRLIRYNCSSMHQELSSLGVPKKDHKWVRLARSSNSNDIVTDDIDLFDPAKKNSASSAAKQKIKLAGKGPVQKTLKKKYNINVSCPEKFCSC